MSASNRFKSTFIWWFTTLFGRLGVLFAVAASVLVLGTYYIVNWAVAEKDNILDAHDAYYHYQFVQSWGDVLDTTQIKKELDNLRIFGSILYSLKLFEPIPSCESINFLVPVEFDKPTL